jgi:hypothetical protein
MSEYQYYEFQTIDRPLTADEQDEIRQLSSRVIPNQIAKATDLLPSSPALLPKEKGAQSNVPRPLGEGLRVRAA